MRQRLEKFHVQSGFHANGRQEFRHSPLAGVRMPRRKERRINTGQRDEFAEKFGGASHFWSAALRAAARRALTRPGDFKLAPCNEAAAHRAALRLIRVRENAAQFAE